MSCSLLALGFSLGRVDGIFDTSFHTSPSRAHSMEGKSDARFLRSSSMACGR